MSLVLLGLCQGYYSETRNVNTANGPTQIGTAQARAAVVP